MNLELCQWTGCARTRLAACWGCAFHWRRLPPHLRLALIQRAPDAEEIATAYSERVEDARAGQEANAR